MLLMGYYMVFAVNIVICFFRFLFDFLLLFFQLLHILSILTSSHILTCSKRSISHFFHVFQLISRHHIFLLNRIEFLADVFVFFLIVNLAAFFSIRWLYLSKVFFYFLFKSFWHIFLFHF